MTEVSCTNEQKVRFTVSPTTSTGAPAALDGAIVITLDDSAMGTVSPGNGLTDGVVTPTPGFLGAITGSVSGDADLGAGVEALADTFMINVTGAKAVNLGVSAAVEPQ